MNNITTVLYKYPKLASAPSPKAQQELHQCKNALNTKKCFIMERTSIGQGYKNCCKCSGFDMVFNVLSLPTLEKHNLQF